jgi:Niemann-Pick C1 protein
MERWDLPYDYITLVALQMAIGLCVDYAVHVGHMFMTIDCPDKEERAIRSVLEIGPAVFHGGMSTLLMFGAMATVNSYSSQAFIKVFFLVIVFGLYHGLIFLPIVLSWIGPKPYAIKYDDTVKSTMPLKPADIFTINASTNQLHSFSYTDTIDIRL